MYREVLPLTAWGFVPGESHEGGSQTHTLFRKCWCKHYNVEGSVIHKNNITSSAISMNNITSSAISMNISSSAISMNLEYVL